ncbi:MAG: hypothetical protein MUF21_01735 [Gemmatimonadaceae bacterium]|nr:hypothetical protein [Gemmatimonadaceae bacterium]
MSLFEIIGEAEDPGSVGRVKVRPPEAEGGSVREVVTRAILALAIVVIAVILAARAARGADGTLIALGALLAYLVVSALVSPEPDVDNLGLAGGLANHPTRVSDDLNRLLLLFAVLLAPGRWVTRQADHRAAGGRLSRSTVPAP